MKRILALILSLSFFLQPLNLALAATGCTYPTTLDSFTDKVAGDSLTVADVNKFHCAIEKTEAELGLLPKGSDATVRARLDRIDAAFAQLAGRAGGQTLIGGTAASEKLRLRGTSHSTRGVVELIDPLAFSVVSPSQITGNQNDYAGCTDGVCLVSSDAIREVTGLTGGVAGRTLEIYNVGSFPIIFKHESSSSSAANRISSMHFTDIELRAGQGGGLRLTYDAANSRWRGARIGGEEGLTVVKNADETVNNSSTLQNDDHLLFTGAAGGIYRVELQLLLSATSGTPDFKFGWTVPSGATMFWGADGTVSGGDAFTTTYWTPRVTGGAPATLLTEGSTLSIGSANGTTGVKLEGIVRVSSTAGSVQFQWAQDTTNASDSKVLKDSVMRVTRLQ